MATAIQVQISSFLGHISPCSGHLSPFVSVHHFTTNSRPCCARDSARLGLSCEHCHHHQIFTTAQPPRSVVSVDSTFRFKLATSVSCFFLRLFFNRGCTAPFDLEEADNGLARNVCLCIISPKIVVHSVTLGAWRSFAIASSSRAFWS